MDIFEENRPKYCPNCGAELVDIIDTYEEHDNGTITIVYDVYCVVCGWSGDISPDSVHRIKKPENLE